MEDTLGLEPSARKGVRVQILPPLPWRLVMFESLMRDIAEIGWYLLKGGIFGFLLAGLAISILLGIAKVL